MARILVVTPDAALARMTLWILAEQKHETATAPDGVKAIASFDDFRPDIVLFNGTMGREKQIQAERMHQALPGVRVVGVHDNHYDGPERHIKAEAYLHKPFHAEDLLALVNELLTSK
jgi:two-component system response regulator MtrA